MDQQQQTGLTIIQLLSLIALLGIALTIAAWLWPGPDDAAGTDFPVQQEEGVTESQ